MAVQETPWIAFPSLALELELPDNVSGFQVGVRVLDSAFHAPWQSFYQPSHLPSPKPDLLAYFLGMDIHTIANSSFSTNDISIGTPVCVSSVVGVIMALR